MWFVISVCGVVLCSGGEQGEGMEVEGEGQGQEEGAGDAAGGAQSEGGSRIPKHLRAPKGPVPSLLAVDEARGLVVVGCVGIPRLYTYALPSLELRAEHSLERPPLGLAFAADGTLLVSAEAPVYLSAYRLGADGSLTDAEVGVVGVVKAYATDKGIVTEVDVDDAFKSGMLAHQAAAVTGRRPQVWNNRERKDRFLENRKKRRVEEGQQQGQGGGDGEAEGAGEGAE